jgi:hypothetical protein
VVGKRDLLVYRLPEADGSLNNELENIEPIKEFRLDRNTYDEILNV